ncbi:DNA-binding transcriptional regulator YhcF, GntR family [Micromonospora nigra]|uniref:DNA-binding transcriptional regulator YhcF, GntR family n=2 Tax=Micromonospora nigra TaxID=145857 RepID=A0A1C6RHT3_9ACTN|nr:DNA-binding transcriptional regulator YhcF, GntR family [Micromonospora nigra]
MSSPRPRLTRGESMYQQIARHIRNEIAAGVRRDGDVLPSSRELAAEWDTSSFTITEAMKVLEAEGFIESKSRSKRVVRVPNQERRSPVRLPKPRVVLVGGYPGSGKTELGRILARATGWPMLDKDTLTRPVVEVALEILGLSPHDRESKTYLEVVRPREYEALSSAAEENVQCGNSAIVTAPFIAEFQDPQWLSRTNARFTDMGASVSVVWVYCDPDTMNLYIRKRGAARDSAKLADWTGYLGRIDTDFRPLVEHVVINNCTSAKPLQHQAEALVKSLMGLELD